jgi:hypothetical protein
MYSDERRAQSPTMPHSFRLLGFPIWEPGEKSVHFPRDFPMLIFSDVDFPLDILQD